jgi:hypothetical protein
MIIGRANAVAGTVLLAVGCFVYTDTAPARTLGITTPAMAVAQQPAEPQRPSEPPKTAQPSQPQPAPPPAGARNPLPAIADASTQNVEIELTIEERGTAKPTTKKLAFVVADGTQGQVRSGLEIGVSTGAPVVSYRDVGLNVDARPRVVGISKVALALTLEFSSVVPGDAKPPAFGRGKTSVDLVLDSGKPLAITTADDGEMGRQYAIRVKATILK